MAGANNFPAYLSDDTARKHRRDERKRARDSPCFCETRAIARRRQWLTAPRCACWKRRHVSARARENRPGVALRNVLVSDIARNNKQLHTRLSIFYDERYSHAYVPQRAGCTFMRARARAAVAEKYENSIAEKLEGRKNIERAH